MFSTAIARAEPAEVYRQFRAGTAAANKWSAWNVCVSCSPCCRRVSTSSASGPRRSPVLATCANTTRIFCSSRPLWNCWLYAWLTGNSPPSLLPSFPPSLLPSFFCPGYRLCLPCRCRRWRSALSSSTAPTSWLLENVKHRLF